MLLIPITIKGEKMYCTRTSVMGAFLLQKNTAIKTVLCGIRYIF